MLECLAGDLYYTGDPRLPLSVTWYSNKKRMGLHGQLSAHVVAGRLHIESLSEEYKDAAITCTIQESGSNMTSGHSEPFTVSNSKSLWA